MDPGLRSFAALLAVIALIALLLLVRGQPDRHLASAEPPARALVAARA
ncbi:MAG: hypothetical protein ACJ761_04865 [Chloroflexota bacterium]